MAKDTRTDTEKFDEAVTDALTPNGPALADRREEEEIFVGRTEMSEPEVELVDAGYDVPEVHVRNLERRHPTASVVIPPEGLGSIDLPIAAHLGAKRVEDVFAEDDAPEISDEDRSKAAADGKTARQVAEDRESDKS